MNEIYMWNVWWDFNPLHIGQTRCILELVKHSNRLISEDNDCLIASVKFF